MSSKGKVAVALSGGLDSSVTALLLQKDGYEVVGITAKMVCDENFDEVVKNAKNVADTLGIEHFVLDLSKEFKENVIDYFENSYKNAETPNPCIVCNKAIKWGALLDYSINELHVDFMATGHYAKLKNEDGKYLLYPAQDIKKDQLYYLFDLSQEQLSRTMFPLSAFLKNQVRVLAFENGLPTASAKESQDICFIKKPMSVKKYILNITEPLKGDFVLEKTGEKIGEHEGFYQYTVGQRKGIGIAYSEPLYVTNLDAEKNIVYLGTNNDLCCHKVLLERFNWHDDSHCVPFEAMVKIRYNMDAQKALVTRKNECVEITFFEGLSASAKGQAGVVYDMKDGHLIGGGWIKEIL
ncbi:MAG: tRNA 2-thiouridine(34) synthase MnmA [Candidatus Gastranaerophilales bacterium]|nr:tRNA 2-thiouridine(34) synthase MnmA [Candidatus Gastranaerophilales bacterium]